MKSFINNYILLCLAGVAAFLRFYHLDFQSLWLDELYTMRECDTNISWGETINLVNNAELKSPLYFLIVKLFFVLFGYTGMVARTLSAIVGVLCLPAMYLLGKELFDRKTGIIAAILTCVNYFLIYYSQEARGYTFLFLFSALATLFFVRILKNPNFKNSVFYGLCSILAVHFHIYAMLIVLSQLIIGVYCFFLVERDTRATYIKWFGMSALIFIIGFVPIIPSLIYTVGVSSMWVPMPTTGYFIDYFYEFFGNTDFLKPVLLVSIFSYLVKIFTTPKEEGRFIEGIGFTFTLISSSLVIIFLLPYLYSILVIPTPASRYAIVALPFFLLMIAAGINYIINKQASAIVISTFVLISVIDLTVVKDYYKVVNKTQFREVTEFIAKNSEKPYLIINDKTSYQQAFYIKSMNLKNELREMGKNAFLDSLLNPGYAAKYPAFWIVGAHLDTKPLPEKIEAIENNYIILKYKNFYDSWAQLYVSRKNKIDSKWSFADFEQKNFNVILGDSVTSIWDNEFRVSKPHVLAPGNYSMRLLTSGTPLKDIHCHLSVKYNDSLIGSFYTQGNYELSNEFNFSVLDDKSFVIKVGMDNDENNSRTKEDRNAFIKAIYFTKY